MRVRHDSCPVCGSTLIESFIRCTDHLVSREEFALWKCRDCSFVFTQDHPDESESSRYYESDDYISHTASRKNLTEKVYSTARRFMLAHKRKLIEKSAITSPGRILDIGSGTGHFLDEMNRHGWETSGIEINEKARQYSVERFGLKVAGPGEIKSFPDGSYDCITLWHSLEHLQDPHYFLGEIRRLLSPEGIAVVALPNCESADSGYYRDHWAAYDVPRHLWHFNSSTFKLLAGRSGFDLKQSRRLLLDVFYISALSEKYRGASLSFPGGIIKGFWFWLVSSADKRSASSLVYTIMRR